MVSEQQALISIGEVVSASEKLKGIALRTPLQFNPNLSRQFDCQLWLKREDLQVVRSYKLRGAYNKMTQFSKAERVQGVVCASAGNHAQGVAYACQALQVKGRIFMPIPTPKQKVNKVKSFGGEWVEVMLVGDTFDDAFKAAKEDEVLTGAVFVHPFNDPAIMAGQATVGMEILADMAQPIDYLFVPVGGGGLAAGIGSYLSQISPQTRIIGVEPAGAPAMYQSFQAQEVVSLKQIDKFVDGAAVKRVGELTFSICQQTLQEIALVAEGKVCSTILELYNEEAIVVEPAGALTLAVLEQYKKELQGKNVVCVVSGSNNDIMRTEEIKERSLLFEGLKHYFIIRFPQRAGALREFLTHVLGPRDDITHFEYTQKNNRERGPALVGLELENPQDFDALLARMKDYGVDYQWLNDDPMLFHLLI
ncbi:MAG: threonine ammonia-lyase [Bacteroidota bacterium]